MSSFVLLCLLLFFANSCTFTSTDTDLYQPERNDVANVKGQITEIIGDDVLIGSNARIYTLKQYLIVADHKSYMESIHLFNLSDYKSIVSFAPIGQGANEIARLGFIGLNQADREIYVSDHGKQKIFAYKLDSLLANPDYIPLVKYRMEQSIFPSDYYYINDTLSIALIIKPTGNYGFNQYTAQWNMKEQSFSQMPYEHSDVEKKRFSLAVSSKNNVYAEFHSKSDLITVCDLEGNLKYNVYGPGWDKERKRIQYYTKGIFAGNFMIATYLGDNPFIESNSEGLQNRYPQKMHVFDIKGNYLRTLDVGYQIVDFCFDEHNNRLIFNFDDEIQFGYLDLDNVL